MRILALTRYDEAGASSRYRVYQYLPHLRSAGVEVDVSPLLGRRYVESLYEARRAPLLDLVAAAFKRVGRLLRTGRYDLIWLEKEVFPFAPALVESLLAITSIPLVVDYDDAIFHNYDLHRSSIVRFLLAKKIDRVMRSATLVLAGNEYLASRAREVGAPWVVVLPTVVDLHRYPWPANPTPSESDTQRIGWIGSPSTQDYLLPIASALSAVCAATKARVRLIGARQTLRLPGLSPEVVSWSEGSEVDELAKCDIGIMPLTNDPWSRGKCGLKLIQYMACGLPVVASPVGVNSEIVEPDVSGYLAETEQEWIAALRTLALDRALRVKMGAAGRARVEQRYSLQMALPTLVGLLAEARERRFTRTPL